MPATSTAGRDSIVNLIGSATIGPIVLVGVYWTASTGVLLAFCWRFVGLLLASGWLLASFLLDPRLIGILLPICWTLAGVRRRFSTKWPCLRYLVALSIGLLDNIYLPSFVVLSPDFRV